MICGQDHVVPYVLLMFKYQLKVLLSYQGFSSWLFFYFAFNYGFGVNVIMKAEGETVHDLCSLSGLCLLVLPCSRPAVVSPVK